MGAVGSHNGNLPPKVMIWQAIATSSDVPSVWSYDCPVDNHKVVSSVDLASGAVCPRHHAALTGEKTVDIS